jgi:hypothetical protein
LKEEFPMVFADKVVLDYKIDPKYLEFLPFFRDYMTTQGHTLSPRQEMLVKRYLYGGFTLAELQTLKRTDPEYVSELTKELGVLALRGYIKTTMVRVYLIWLLYTRPQERVHYITNRQTLAETMIKSVRDTLRTWDVVKHLSEDANTTNASFTSKHIQLPYSKPGSYSLEGHGIDSKMTGIRADYLIFDDIEIRENTTTPEMRSDLEAKYYGCMKLGESGSQPITKITGTPWHRESLYYKIGAKHKFDIDGNKPGTEKKYQTMFVFPALYPSKEQLADYQGLLDPTIEKEILSDSVKAFDSIDPVLVKKEDILSGLDGTLEKRLDVFMNYLMNPFLSSTQALAFPLSSLGVLTYETKNRYKHPIAVADQPHCAKKSLTPFHTFGQQLYVTQWDQTNPAQIIPQWRVMVIDPAGRSNNTIEGEDLDTDETAMCIMAVVNGKFVIEKVDGWTDGFGECTLEQLARAYSDYECDEVIVEENYGGGMFGQLLSQTFQRLGIPASKRGIKNSSNKQRRIHEALQSVLGSKVLFITEKAAVEDTQKYVEELDPSKKVQRLHYSFLHQLCNFQLQDGGSKSTLVHDDRLDAVAEAILQLRRWQSLGEDPSSEKLKTLQQQEFDEHMTAYGKDMAEYILNKRITPEFEKQNPAQAEIALQDGRYTRALTVTDSKLKFYNYTQPKFDY